MEIGGRVVASTQEIQFVDVVDVPNVGVDVGAMKNAIIRDKKVAIRRYIGIDV